MKINRTVNFFWSGEFKRLHLAAMLSYKRHGFTPILWTFDDIDLGEYGITIRNPNEILEFDKSKRYTKWPEYEDVNDYYHQIVLYHDVFRMLAIKKYPASFWSDIDMFCLQPPEVWDRKIHDRTSTLAPSTHNMLNNAVLQFSDTSVLDQVNFDHYYNHNVIRWAAYGPELWDRIQVDRANMANQEWFYPYLMDQVGLPFSSDPVDIAQMRRLTKNSLAFHLWNNSTRGMEIDDNSFIGMFIKEIFNEI